MNRSSQVVVCALLIALVPLAAEACCGNDRTTAPVPDVRQAGEYRVKCRDFKSTQPERATRRHCAVATAYDRRIIVEHGIAGVREIEVSLLGNDEPRASIPGEIIPSNEFYDYDAKYVDGKSTAIVPAQLPKAIVRKLQEFAKRAFRAID